MEIGKVLTGGIPAGGVILAPFGGGGGTYPWVGASAFFATAYFSFGAGAFFALLAAKRTFSVLSTISC